MVMVAAPSYEVTGGLLSLAEKNSRGQGVVELTGPSRRRLSNGHGKGIRIHALVDAKDQEGRSPDLHAPLDDLPRVVWSGVRWGREALSLLDTKRCRGQGLDFREEARYT
jgi:hypothetical protein